MLLQVKSRSFLRTTPRSPPTSIPPAPTEQQHFDVMSSTTASTTSFCACFHSNCPRLQAPHVHKSLSPNLFGLLFFTTLPTPASTQRFWLLVCRHTLLHEAHHCMPSPSSSAPSSFLSACIIAHHFQTDTNMMQFGPRACLIHDPVILFEYVRFASRLVDHNTSTGSALHRQHSSPFTRSASQLTDCSLAFNTSPLPSLHLRSASLIPFHHHY